jgi:hypothetical protein
MHLQKCLKILTKSFPDKWLDELLQKQLDRKSTESRQDQAIDSPTENSTEIRSDLISYTIGIIEEYFTSIASDIYCELNLSLLTGEYINIDKSQEIIKELKEKVNSLQLNIPETETDSYLIESIIIAQDTFTSEFVEPLAKSLLDYSFFIALVDKKLHFSDAIVIRVRNSKEVRMAETNLTTSAEKLFNVSLELANLDHNLAVDQHSLIELATLRNKLETQFEDKPEYFKVVLDKCNYLLKKVLYRFSQDNKDVLYIHDLNQQRLNYKDIGITIYKKFDDISPAHYEIVDNWKGIIKRKAQAILDSGGLQISSSYEQYHTMMKYYKDVICKLDALIEINESFKDKYLDGDSQIGTELFNRSASNINFNYMNNNELSLLIEQKSDRITIENKYNEIIKIQKDTKIFNYFPHVKIAEYYISEAEILISSEKPNYLDLGQLLEKLRKVVNLSRKNFHWCKERNFFVFQLPFEECKLDAEALNNEKLFICSSFVLPLNYTEAEKKIIEIEREQERFIAIEKSSKALQQQREVISTSIQDESKKVENKLNSDIKEAEKRSIEILGIFSAVVLFALGSLQIFNIDGTTFTDALKFMLCFAYGLVLFVLAIWLVTRRNIEEEYQLWEKPLFWYVLVSAALAFFAILYSTQPEGKNIKSNKKDTTSIKSQPTNQKTDSSSKKTN